MPTEVGGRVSQLLLLVIVIGIAVLAMPASGFAQATSGAVNGTVGDSSGAVIVNANVKLISTLTNVIREAVTDRAGYYQFLLVPPGTYAVEVRNQGFKTFRRAGITVEANRSLAVPVTLEVGAVAETIEVREGTPLLEPNTSALGTVMDSRKVEDLPLNGRNPMGLANLIPTVRGIGYFGGEILSTWRMGQLVIAGSSPLNNGYLIDGIANEKMTDYSAMAFLPVDATAEFKVQTNAMSAEFGRTGGGVVSVISKSGTNQYHGNLFEYLRNTRFNSNEFFANKAGARRPPVKVNTFGGTVGGPIRKDKIFFFYNMEGFRARRTASMTTSSPDDLQRSGDFSQTFNSAGQLIQINDPLSTRQDPTRPAGNYIRDAFAGNKIPAARLNPIAQKILTTYYPKPNLPGLPFTHAQNMFLQGATPIDKNNLGIKIDYNLTASRRISGRFSRDMLDWGFTNYLNSIADTDGRHILDPRRTAVLEYTDTLSPTLLLSARIGVNREQEHTVAPGHDFDVTTLGFSPNYANQIQKGMMGVGFPSMGITDGASFGRPDSTGNPTATGTANVAVTKVLGKQSIKAGFEQRLYRRSDWGTSNSSGAFSFGRSWTQANPLATSTTSGYGVATFLLGNPTAGSVGVQTDSAVSMNFSALYVQDDWKVSKKLTLNLGLRWEYEGPVKDRRNIFPNIDLSIPTGLQVPGMTLKGGYVWPGTNGLPNGLTDQNFRNLGPRLGFAYQCDPKTVIRGGFGITYIPTFGPGGSAAGAGFVTSTSMMTSADGGLTPYGTWASPFPSGITWPQGNKLGAMTGIGTSISAGQLRNVKRGYGEQWNLTVQHQPWNNWLFEAAWVANHGVHLTMGGQPLSLLPDQYLAMGADLTTQVPNPFYGYIVGTGTTLANATVTKRQLLLPYPQFLGVSGGSVYRGNSIYHAFTFKVEKRFSYGFSMLSSYTFSKLLDDLGSTGRPGAIGGTGVQNWWNLRLERSRSYQDMPQRVVLTAQWELPFKPANPVLKGIVGGWQLNGMSTIESGRVITPAASITGGGNRPNVNPGVSQEAASQDMFHWFNNVSCTVDPARAAFCQPASYTYGNAPRTLNTVRGPSFFNFDASIFKTFPITERYKLQFRAEGFNVSNTPQFEPPSGSISSATYGVITSTITPAHAREVQFALRLLF